MKKFIYRDNKQSPPLILAEIVAEDILDADKQFQEKTNLNPVKIPSIGCQIEKLKKD